MDSVLEAALKQVFANEETVLTTATPGDIAVYDRHWQQLTSNSTSASPGTVASADAASTFLSSEVTDQNAVSAVFQHLGLQSKKDITRTEFQNAAHLLYSTVKTAQDSLTSSIFDEALISDALPPSSSKRRHHAKEKKQAHWRIGAVLESSLAHNNSATGVQVQQQDDPLVTPIASPSTEHALRLLQLDDGGVNGALFGDDIATERSVTSVSPVILGGGGLLQQASSPPALQNAPPLDHPVVFATTTDRDALAAATTGNNNGLSNELPSTSWATFDDGFPTSTQTETAAKRVISGASAVALKAVQQEAATATEESQLGAADITSNGGSTSTFAVTFDAFIEDNVVPLQKNTATTSEQQVVVSKDDGCSSVEATSIEATDPMTSGVVELPRMSVQDQERCIQAFTKQGYGAAGGVNQQEATRYYQKSYLPKGELFDRMWTLADEDKDGKLNQQEFCVFLHLMRLKKSGHGLPKTLDASQLLPVMEEEEAPNNTSAPNAASPSVLAATATTTAVPQTTTAKTVAPSVQQQQTNSLIMPSVMMKPFSAPQSSLNTTIITPITVPTDTIRAALGRPASASLFGHRGSNGVGDVCDVDPSESSDDDDGFEDDDGVSQSDKASVWSNAPPVSKPENQTVGAPASSKEEAGKTMFNGGAGKFEGDSKYLDIQIVAADIKYSKPLDRPFVSVSIMDSFGRLSELPQDTPPGVYRKETSSIFFNHSVTIKTPLKQLPPNGCFVFEIKHWKSTSKKFSTLAWTKLSMDDVVDIGPKLAMVRTGPVMGCLYRKPVEVNMAKAKKLGGASGKGMHILVKGIDVLE